jgi:Mn-dependent DtxR family transcriptional regulator
MDTQDREGAEELSVQPLADGQRRVLRIIQQYIDFRGKAPTTAYVAECLQLNHKTVREHLRACHRKGWLRTPTPGGFWCRIG